jgi:amidase
MAARRSPFVPHDLRAPIQGAAIGPLAGLTAAIKDMYDIEGERAGGGNSDWLAQAKPAKKTCPSVQKLLDAGATVIGKTITEEFFFSVIGINPYYGAPVNVRAPGRVSGGSSSGSASATAAGICDFALGSDTGGSVRIPASFCGLYGIRPTHGRVDLTGAMAMAPSLDAAGWFASGPGLFRKVGSVLLGGKSIAEPTRHLIVLEDAFAAADPAIAQMTRDALATMSADLPQPKHETIAPDGFEPWRECFRVVQGYEIWREYGDFVKRHNPRLGPGVRERMQYASTVTGHDYDRATAVREKLRERAYSLAQPGTLLALPASPVIAPRIDTPEAELDRVRARILHITSVASLSGLPQITIPVGTVEGCPAGLSFIGWAGGDEALLDLSLKLSRYCGIAA